MAKVLARRDIRKLSTEELDNLISAFEAICKLEPDDPDSFFNIAGYHGEPFRGAGYGNPSWWGGYCNHGNVLFPTWHRAYLWRLEQALQKHVPGVTLPYWNEIDKETTKGEGIPAIFLLKDYKFTNGDRAGEIIPNPLHSYTFQRTITDRLSPIPDADYSKPAGYTTMRYPFSGLVGESDIDATEVHNKFMDELGVEKTNKLLNENVQTWLNFASFRNSDGKKMGAGVKDKYEKCLHAENYTVFSNTTSAAHWNDEHGDIHGYPTQVPLESPHNAIHLAVGGCQVPGFNASAISGANGDMGENDTASFDPIFFFHHCFIDLMFWRWQLEKHKTKELEIIPGYPGTNSVDNQGPTPGVSGGTWLTLDSPLDPFVKPDGSGAMISKDVVNIESLGYTYELPTDGPRLQKPRPSPHLSIGGINRAAIGGSFVVSAWAFTSNAEPARLIGTEPVLSRWHVSGCANCQSHLEVRAHIPLEGWSDEDATNTSFEVRVHTHSSPGGLVAPGGKRPVLGGGTVAGRVRLAGIRKRASDERDKKETVLASSASQS